MQKVKKSRFGCIACKQKKIRCDEGKPECLRCLRLRKPCPGYNSDLRWSDKHEVLKKRSSFRGESQPSKGRQHSPSPVADISQTYSSTNAPEVILPPGYSEFEEGSIEVGFGSGLSDVRLDSDEALWSSGFLERVDISSPAVGTFGNTTYYQAYGPSNSGTRFSDRPSENHMLLSHWSSNRFHFDTLDQTLAPAAIIPWSTRPALIRNPVDTNSMLVEYYFSVVASFYSCFDGNLNPFRTTVGRIWSSSESMMLTLKSMAAACLSRDLPHLAKEGMTFRSQAIEQINKDLLSGHNTDTTILCLIMLGQSAGWHHVADLGLQQYQCARRLIEEDNFNKTGLVTINQNSPFLQQAVHYWKMILSFISDLGEPEDRDVQNSRRTGLTMQTMPHPWALIAPEMMNTISKVGKLVYSHRKMVRNQKFWKRAHVADIDEKIEMCKRMEQSLLFHRLPTEDEIIDPGDSSTPVSHLLAVAEAYRIVSLIQLYRVFPDVLLERLQNTDLVLMPSNVPQPPIPEDLAVSESEAQRWLKQLVQYAVDILSTIPFESHTRSIQAFLYVALSSEIRKPTTSDLSYDMVQAVEARNLIRSRLEAYRFVFAHKPAQRKLDLVLKVWDRMDNSNNQVYWMDVMIDNNLEVVFC